MRAIVDAVIRMWWVFVIVVPLTILGAAYAIDYATDQAIKRDRAQAAKVREADKAQAAKNAAADRRQRAQIIASQNKLICLFIGLVDPQLKSYRAAAKDETLSASARARNDKRIRDTQAIRDELVTVPPDYKCPAPEKTARPD